MLLDDPVLVGGETGRLAQDQIRDADLAEVVEQAGDPDGAGQLGSTPRRRARNVP